MVSETKTQVLVLDDEVIVGKRLRPCLEKIGYAVETFTCSAEAMERIREKEFDIVITDLKMEGIDGLQFLAEVKQRSAKTEVIVITGFATMETARDSFKRGVFDFIAKPFKLGEIQEVVKKAERRVMENRTR